MSRTDKDRPYWVKTNDPKMERYVDHQHLAYKTYKDVFVEIELEEYKAKDERWRYTHSLWFTPEKYWYKERVVDVEYGPECNEGTPTNKDTRGYYLCTYELEHYVYSPYKKGSRTSNKSFQRSIHGSDRAAFRNAAKDYLKFANSDDYEEDLYDDVKVQYPRNKTRYDW